MTVEEQIREALVAAQKARAKEELAVLRMAISDIKYASIAKRAQLDDQAVFGLLRKMVKQRHEAAGIYRSGGRPDRAEAEEREIPVLEKFLPKSLDEQSLRKILLPLIEQNPDTPTLRLMKEAMALVSGRADGRQVKAALEALQPGS